MVILDIKKNINFFLVLIFSIIFLLKIIFVQAAGKTYYVSKDGKKDFTTIQAAANAVSPGDTVIVLANGDYSNERVQITKSGNSDAPITFESDGIVISKGFNINADYIIIKNFEIANTDYQNLGSMTTSSGIYIKGKSNIIEKNYIHDSSLIGIYIYGRVSDATISQNNKIINNRLYHNGHRGIVVNGRNNLIEGNEIWETVQCHPTALKIIESKGQTCNHNASYDADGINFFGQGHIFKNNYIHDIKFSSENVDPHIDCFQTFSDSNSFEAASNIVFEGNRCLRLDGNAGWQLEKASYLTIKNNVVETNIGINTANGGNHHLDIYNNVFISGSEGVEILNTPYSKIKNNIFYNNSKATVYLKDDKTGVEIRYNLAYNSNSSFPKCITYIQNNNYSCLALTAPYFDHNLWENSSNNYDPKFENPISGDYRPKSDSLVCGAGENGVDIGAYSCLKNSQTLSTAPTNTMIPLVTPIPTPTPIPGDGNNDNKVNETDYNIWVNYYNQTVNNGPLSGDFNKNNKVDGVDYVIWLNNFTP